MKGNYEEIETRAFVHKLYDQLPPDQARLAKRLWTCRERLNRGEAWEILIPEVERLIRDAALRAYNRGGDDMFRAERGEEPEPYTDPLPADFALVEDKP